MRPNVNTKTYQALFPFRKGWGLGTRLIIDIGVEGLETGSRERIVTIHFRVKTPCCARTAKFLPSLSPVDCVSCSVTGFHSC